MTLTALSVSAGLMVFYCLLAQLARICMPKYVRNPLHRNLFNEAIASAELCACCFELIIVADNFGVAAYAICLFVLTVWWSHVWDDASACPYTHMEELVEGKQTLSEVGLKIWAQLMGGCCVFRLIQIIWWFEFVKTHEGRAFEECTSDLQVHPYMGAVIEGVATLLCRLCSKAIAENNPKYATFIDSFFGTALVVAAFNFSGGYFNPVLATSLKWGCSGHGNLDHIIVYWIGACVGSILSIPIYNIPSVKQLLTSKMENIKEKDT